MSTIRTGTVMLSNSVGANNDLFVLANSYMSLYKRRAGVYVHVGNLRGVAGPPGADGGAGDLTAIQARLTSAGILVGLETPNAVEDVFPTGALDAKWAWRNQGTAAASCLDNCLVLVGQNGNGATTDSRNIEQTIAAAGGDWAFRARLWVVKADAGFHFAGLTVVENGTGKLMSIGYVRKGTGSPTYALAVMRYASVTGFTSYDAELDILSHLNMITMPPVVVEIAKESGNLKFRYGFGEGGKLFDHYSIAVATPFTTGPDRVGLAVDSANASNAPTLVASRFWKAA